MGIADHLPECSAHYEFGTILNDCICDMLRACEQRAFEKGWNEGEEVGYDRGRTSGLMSAEAAVAELPLTGGWTTPDGVIEEVDKAKALAAIRALKEEG